MRPLYPPPPQLVHDLEAGRTYEVENLRPQGRALTADARPTYTPLRGGPGAITGSWRRLTFPPGTWRFISTEERK